MSQLAALFKMAGVTSARDKILALCNAPQIFVEIKGASEDWIMCTYVPRLAGDILLDDLIPAVLDETDQHSRALRYASLKRHLHNTLFQHPDAAFKRNLAYAMKDPEYLDALIASIKQMMVKWNDITNDYRTTIDNFLMEETQFPLFYFNSEYKKYYDVTKAR